MTGTDPQEAATYAEDDGAPKGRMLETPHKPDQAEDKPRGT